MVHFGRIGKRVGRRLLMVTFNNERAVEIILDRAAILNKTRHFKHIYIMKDRPRSERPNGESNTLLEAANGSTSSNRRANTVGGAIQNGGPETPARGAPSDRVPQTANAEISNVNQGSTTDVTQSRTATPNNRTPNARDARTGSTGSPVSSFLNLITTGTNLFGWSPRTRGEETQAPVNIEQRNTQSGNRGRNSRREGLNENRSEDEGRGGGNTTNISSSQGNEMVNRTNRRKKNKVLKMMNINAQSLCNKMNELEFKVMKVTEPQIISISESWGHEDSNFNLEGYKMYRDDRERRGGGAILFIKAELDQRECKTLKSLNYESIAWCWVIEKGGKKH